MPQNAIENHLEDRIVHLQALFETIPDLVWVKDEEGVFLECNSRFLEFFGLSRKDVVGKKDSDIVDQESAEFFRERDLLAMQSSVPLCNEETLESLKTGQKGLFETIKVRMTLQDGKVVGVLGIARDISKRKDYELLLQKRLDALIHLTQHKETLKFEDLFDSETIQRLQDQFADATRVASIITRPDGVPLTKPSNFTKFCFGIVRNTEIGLMKCIRSDAVIGGCHSDCPHIQPCLSAGLWDAGVPIVVGGVHVANWMIGQVRDETQEESHILEYAEEIGADPERILEAFREVPSMSYDQFKKIAEVLQTFVDQITSVAYQNLLQSRHISDRNAYESKILDINDALKKTTHELSERNEELIVAAKHAEESDRLKSAFLANMSHEIRTPLNAILGFSSFLNDPDLTRDEIAHYVDIITQSGENLLELINNIIDISKIDAGIVTLNIDPIDVKLLLRQLYSIHYSRLVSLQKGDVDLKISLPSYEIVTQTDKLRLRQIVDNLLSNALKFTEKGTVEMGVEVRDKQVFFWVKDSGIGILERDFEKIFDRFQQADQPDEKLFGGTGLGLSIAKSCVELLKGRIWLESEWRKGTVFYFTIPYQPMEDLMETPPKSTLANSVFDGEHVLIAEDDPVNYEYLRTVLKK